jgi:uncharacterized Zn-binding protein involved in type VI secretion
MTLLTLLNPILPFPVAAGGGSGWTSIPPPPGGHVSPIAIAVRYLPPVSLLMKLNRGQSAQWHNSSQKQVTYLFESVISSPSIILGNAVNCHVRVQGKPIALLNAWGDGHAPFGIPHPPHAAGVWKVTTTSAKLRVKGLPAARLGDLTTCGHSVIKAHPKLITA